MAGASPFVDSSGRHRARRNTLKSLSAFLLRLMPARLATQTASARGYIVVIVYSAPCPTGSARLHARECAFPCARHAQERLARAGSSELRTNPATLRSSRPRNRKLSRSPLNQLYGRSSTGLIEGAGTV